jgi:ATP-dependent helicase STH1/SNF2
MPQPQTSQPQAPQLTQQQILLQQQMAQRAAMGAPMQAHSITGLPSQPQAGITAGATPMMRTASQQAAVTGTLNASVGGANMAAMNNTGVAQPAVQTSGNANAATMATNGVTPNGTPTFSQDQLETLRHQICAFKLINKNMPVPEHLQRAIFGLGGDLKNTAESTATTATAASGNDSGDDKATAAAAKIADTAHAFHTAMAQQQQNASNAANAPFASYTNPYAYLQNHISYHAHASRQQRLLVPAIMPVGISPFELAQEREHRIRARIQHRIQELESLPSNLGDAPFDGGRTREDSEASDDSSSTASAKIRALIELRALRLLDRQRRLRDEITRSMKRATTLATAADRAAYRRQKKQSLREARMTERVERQQRIERERRLKQKHLDYLQTIVNHGRDMAAWHRAHQRRHANLTRLVMQQHASMEREEQRRAERAAKERLKALKADDEETYKKLVSEAKNDRLKHLLEQTDSYLKKLAEAVKEQQNATGGDPNVPFPEDDDDTSRADYYSIAHRIREPVTEQPSILVGGKLKEYQLRGLEWMVSLYNNRLNGILAGKFWMIFPLTIYILIFMIDEMGLGKTIQTISLVTFLIEKKRQNGPFLIIVPLS